MREGILKKKKIPRGRSARIEMCRNIIGHQRNIKEKKRKLDLSQDGGQFIFRQGSEQEES